MNSNAKYDLSVNLINSENISGEKIGLTAYTRPSVITTSNVSQNTSTTTSSSIVFNWNKGQDSESANINKITFGERKGRKSNGTVYDEGSIDVALSDNTPNASLTDVTLTGLVANTQYDFSANQVNIYDMSQVNMLAFTGYTRPQDIIASKI